MGTTTEKAKWDALTKELAKKLADKLVLDPTFAPGPPRPWNNPARHAPWV